MGSSECLTVFAGINGAGKSTLFGTLSHLDFGVRLNSDEIVKELGLDWRDPKAQMQAGRLLLERQEECFKKRLSFNRESTIAGMSAIRCMQEAKNLGYTVVMYYVGVASPEIAKERVKEREAKGGHGVSEETVERRFGRSRENLDVALPLCDIIHIFDNTVSLKELCTVRDGKLEAMAECRWQEDERYAWLGKLLKRIGVE